MRLFRPLLGLLKGAFDLLASYLLAWVLLFALLAGLFWLVATLVVGLFGFETLESFWLWLDRIGPVNVVVARLLLFALLHLLALLVLRRHLRRVQLILERAVDRGLARFRRWAKRHPRGRLLTGASFTLTLSLLLVPFVIQPTLVPLGRWGGQALAARAANLVDGSATAALAESVVGLYRKVLYAPPEGYEISAEAFGRALSKGDAARLLIDRWDPLIRTTVGDDRRAFALLKAVIWVESAGRRFAVSRTGCVGLTQFCSRTARSGGFRRIFGVGQVYPCRCDGRCRVPKAVQRDLETGDPAKLALHRDSFVCDISDARFDPRKSIRAGHAYVSRLGREFAGNIYVIYVGYNSGPQVARRLWSAIGGAPAASLSTIGPHLSAALGPYYGKHAGRRARSLLRVHLPKLRRAFEGFHAAARSSFALDLRPEAVEEAAEQREVGAVQGEALAADRHHRRAGPRQALHRTQRHQGDDDLGQLPVADL